jgi:uncharacterized protein HemX
MVYAIGALAACLCIAAGVGIGYLIWGQPVMMSLAERIELQNQQLQLEGQLRASPGADKQRALDAISQRLNDAERRAEAQWSRATRANRRRLLKDVTRNLEF